MSDELDEIQAIFFEECVEGLTSAEEGLSAMREGDVSAAIIAGVFRAVHSIKGGAGAFGHAALTAFAHRFENVLDEVRAGRIAPTGGVTRTMLTAFDVLADHVAAAQGHGAAPADEAALAALEDVLQHKGESAITAAAAASGPAESMNASPFTDEFGFTPVLVEMEQIDELGFTPIGVSLDDLCDPAPAPWSVTFGPSRAALANAGEPMLILRELEDLGGKVVSIDWSTLPELRDLDPEASYLVYTIEVPGDVAEPAITDCFDFLAPDSTVLIERRTVEIQVPAPIVTPEPASHRMDEAPQATLAPVARQAALPIPAADPHRNNDGARTADAGGQTIRVDIGRLDMLLNLVGELVIRNSILSDRLSPKDQERVELPELARLTREIQDNVMSLRAQPIRQAFSRVPRLLRDLAAETGKEVVLETIGETTEVDKGVIEKIGDPLTHMIRNAVDHGIESPEERVAKGKPRQGQLRLSAEQKGARILVRVSDDGRGIDRDRVRCKAIEKGIIAADATLSNEEIDQLICAPGFSTAESISNISGRGVGMDVVRSNVEALGGRVEILNTPGQGATFTMILPLTLAILDGMIVRLGTRRYVLPLANVLEAIQPAPGQVQALTPNSEVIELRGHYVPVRRLSKTFDVGAKDLRAPEDSLVIIVESETAGQVGLMVDTIDDRREVVIKSLDQNLYPIRGLSGATLLGDGTIALILDVEALVAPTPGLAGRYTPKGLAA